MLVNKLFDIFLNHIFFGRKENIDKVCGNSFETEDKNKLFFPTSEEIDIYVRVNIHNLLLYFFPNSFKTENEAYEYYKNFCEKAKKLGEDEEIYKAFDLYSGFFINIKLIWNDYYKNSYNTCVSFKFFSFTEIKSEELKNEIKQLYLENIEFLDSIGFCAQYSWGDLSVNSRVEICPDGVDFKLPNEVIDFHSFKYYMNTHKDIFKLPTNSILEILRVIKTHNLSLEDCRSLENKIKENINGNIFKCEIDFENSSAEIANKFMSVSLNTKYFYPADTVTNYETGRDYKYIDLF